MGFGRKKEKKMERRGRGKNSNSVLDHRRVAFAFYKEAQVALTTSMNGANQAKREVAAAGHAVFAGGLSKECIVIDAVLLALQLSTPHIRCSTALR